MEGLMEAIEYAREYPSDEILDYIRVSIHMLEEAGEIDWGEAMELFDLVDEL